MPQYEELIPFLDSESHAKVLEIDDTKSQGGFVDEEKENAEFVSFVNTSSRRLISVFNEIRSVNGCWLRMCKDIENLFSDVDEERLGSLEILSITNLRLLETISCGASFKTLKKLSIDCCPKIKMLFLDASQLPSSLEVLHIKFCEKLERVFGEEYGNVSTLTTLCLYESPVLSTVAAKLPNLETLKKRNFPQLHATKDILKGSEKVMVDDNEA